MSMTGLKKCIIHLLLNYSETSGLYHKIRLNHCVFVRKNSNHLSYNINFSNPGLDCIFADKMCDAKANLNINCKNFVNIFFLKM